jgi:predicted nucleic acid-binding protein
MNKLIMIDSSCWIKYFRNSDDVISENIQELIKNNTACLCGIIELEIIRGIKNTKQEDLVKDLFSILKYFDFQRDDFINAGSTIRRLSTKGITITPSDCLIAELCIKNNLSIYTVDKDFNYFINLEKYK